MASVNRKGMMMFGKFHNIQFLCAYKDIPRSPAHLRDDGAWSWFGRPFEDRCQAPSFLLKHIINQHTCTHLISSAGKQNLWKAERDAAPWTWQFLTGSPHWQTGDSWPRPSLIPEQRGNCGVSRNDEWQRGNLVHDAGSWAHLVRESSLCWLLALFKHATEDIFLLAGGINSAN